MLRGYTLGWLGAIIVVVSAATVIVVGILRGGGGPSDEQAVRAWFQSPAGGSASKSMVVAIHVGTCSPADATNQSDPVFKCPITTDAGTTPSPLPDTCFKFAGDRVASGGWQLAPVDHCNALRFDSRTDELVDIPGHAHYRVTRS
jgi:hypothetical protein